MVSSCPNSGSVLSSLSDPGLPLGRYSWRRGWTGAFESQGSDHLFHMARFCFHPKLSGTPSHRSVEDLELLVEIRGFSDHLRLDLVPLFELSDQPLSVFPRSLDSDIITMYRSADSPRASSEYKRMLACPLRKPISSKKPPSSHSQF